MSIPSVIAEAQAHYEKAPTGPLPYTIARPLLEALIAAESQLSACRALIEQWRVEIEQNRTEQVNTLRADEAARLGWRIEVRTQCADDLSVLLRGEP